jgi:hypothetical protein
MTHSLEVIHFKTQNWEMLNKMILNKNTSIYSSVPVALRKAAQFNRCVINSLLGLFIERLITDSFTMGEFNSSDRFINAEVMNLDKRLSEYKALQKIETSGKYAEDSQKSRSFINQCTNGVQKINNCNVTNPFCATNHLYIIDKSSIKTEHLNCYLNSKNFMDRFVKYIDNFIKYSCARAIQNEQMFADKRCHKYLKQAIQFCFALKDIEFIKIWLEFMIQVRYSPIGARMHESYKNGKLSKNIEFRSIFAGTGRQKKYELDFVTHEYLGEIKFYSAFQPKEIIIKLDKARDAMPKDFEYVNVDKYIIIDAFNCNIHYQS